MGSISSGTVGQVMLGGVVSETMIENVQSAELPAASVAVQVTRVLPMGKVSPDVASHDSVGSGSHASVAVGTVKVTAAPAKEGGETRGLEVEGDPQLLERAVRNLLMNAVEAQRRPEGRSPEPVRARAPERALGC